MGKWAQTATAWMVRNGWVLSLPDGEMGSNGNCQARLVVHLREPTRWGNGLKRQLSGDGTGTRSGAYQMGKWAQTPTKLKLF